jgi:glycosyltransferase involved in cell wall biosynthesis
MGLRIGIDCYKLQKNRGKSIGIYNYARILIAQLAKIESREYEIVVFGNELNRRDIECLGVTFVEYKVPTSKLMDVLWELFLVKRVANSQNIDLMIYPRGFKPLGSGRKEMVILHDLIPFYYKQKHPNYFGGLESFYIRLRLKAAIKYAQFVLTISQFSMAEIQRLSDGREDLAFIYNGFEPKCFDNQGQNDIESGHLEASYIIALTSELPHKNAPGVFSCYKSYVDLGGELDLKVVGIQDPNKYRQLVDPHTFSRITFLPFLTDNELYGYIQQAKYLLFLSEIEGFGYPPIEAMSLGTIVISSKGGALQEVVGDGGNLIEDENHAASTLIYLDQHPDLHEGIIQNGYRNIDRFGLKRFGEEMHHFINKAMSR